jgi:hypothetical protein
MPTIALHASLRLADLNILLTLPPALSRVRVSNVALIVLPSILSILDGEAGAKHLQPDVCAPELQRVAALLHALLARPGTLTLLRLTGPGCHGSLDRGSSGIQ